MSTGIDVLHTYARGRTSNQLAVMVDALESYSVHAGASSLDAAVDGLLRAGARRTGVYLERWRHSMHSVPRDVVAQRLGVLVDVVRLAYQLGVIPWQLRLCAVAA